MSNESHNGYTNYATWRIHLEILYKYEFTEPIEASDLEDIVAIEVFKNYDRQTLMGDYAAAFINQVNFYEIAELINNNLD
jgi:hypothetical protein